jgi:NAD(P)H-nitrite reductase large subunit
VAFKDDRIVGCILLGDVRGAREILEAIDKKIEVKEHKDALLKEGFDFKKLK